jgi:hypothetical protein
MAGIGPLLVLPDNRWNQAARALTESNVKNALAFN